MIKKNIEYLTKSGEMSEEEADKMRKAVKKLHNDGIKLSQKNIIREAMKNPNDINDFDWSTLGHNPVTEDDIFHIKGPFLWMKILISIMVIRLVIVAGFAMNGETVRWIDVLINFPLIYGILGRKKWGYYLLLGQLIIINIDAFTLPEPLITGIIWLIIFTIPNFIYFKKRKRYFNIIDDPGTQTSQNMDEISKENNYLEDDDEDWDEDYGEDDSTLDDIFALFDPYIELDDDNSYDLFDYICRRCEIYKIDIPEELLGLIYDDLTINVKHKWVRDDLVGYLRSNFAEFDIIFEKYAAKER